MTGQFGNPEILEFIHRRFPNDSNWLNGNCYFFAKILETAFFGYIVYDPIDGHFLFTQYGNESIFYDWAGAHKYEKDYSDKFEVWELYKTKDPSHYSRVMRDCTL
jgi:hypothetical protein